MLNVIASVMPCSCLSPMNCCGKLNMNVGDTLALQVYYALQLVLLCVELVNVYDMCCMDCIACCYMIDECMGCELAIKFCQS